MSTRPDTEISGAVEIATRRRPRPRVVWDLKHSVWRPRNAKVEGRRGGCIFFTRTYRRLYDTDCRHPYLTSETTPVIAISRSLPEVVSCAGVGGIERNTLVCDRAQDAQEQGNSSTLWPCGIRSQTHDHGVWIMCACVFYLSLPSFLSFPYVMYVESATILVAFIYKYRL